ncbi:MAG: thermostable hemolysin [Pseudomonadales bacterium RIFCSPLOWO2_12_59_9]|jgi:hypothetical protein|nr:MAG: thermostable hemolysin [Pseudomonadales bacterium RIFCSPLOWO2_12_59_9]
MQLPWEHHEGALARIGHDPALSLYLLKQHPCTKRRSEIENFIRVRFAEHYGAKIEHFMPCLLGLENAAGQLQAAVGIRGADAGELFLERYLSRPIEQEITAGNGRYLKRSEIVEVGNLAAVGAGHARLLIVALTDVLVALGFRWVTFTGTTTLLNSFQRLGLSPLSLGLADPACMGAELGAWGSYYATAPQVMVGDIYTGHQRLQAMGVYRRLGYQPLYAVEELANVSCG